MESDAQPMIIGAGLMGRPQIARPADDLVQPIGEDEYGNPVYAQPPSESITIPPNCLRVLNSPRGECQAGCAGLQQDGGCLCDIVKAANAQGVDWKFDVAVDQWGNQRWTYVGPTLA